MYYIHILDLIFLNITRCINVYYLLISNNRIKTLIAFKKYSYRELGASLISIKFLINHSR